MTFWIIFLVLLTFFPYLRQIKVSYNCFFSAEITESKEQNVEDGYCFEEIRQKVEFLVDVVAKQAEQDNASDNINCEVKFNQNGAVNHV